MKSNEEKINPLRRVFRAIPQALGDDRSACRTTDGTTYIIGKDGARRRAKPKVNGKLAKRLRRQGRERTAKQGALP